ncbi:hypothetical protein CRG98_023313 [Punica granatum]|uniref:Uncharacterized protein n=1 Tax=Punica granatum TaxID=22663 RepID=A0A2I0JJ55_PUNGR|nr:hypothetical protein CRG98_023313 [Punica granatum]
MTIYNPRFGRGMLTREAKPYANPIRRSSPSSSLSFTPHRHRHCHSSSDMRGRIGDKWSMRVLWASAIGSGIGLYMVIVERQLQNRERMAAEALQSLDSNSGSREED